MHKEWHDNFAILVDQPSWWYIIHKLQMLTYMIVIAVRVIPKDEHFERSR
jgi:hypothetical protein